MITNQYLDEQTIGELNKLSLIEVSSKVSYSFSHELLWYGIDSIVHFHLMRMAQDAVSGKINLEDFLSKYNVRPFEIYGKEIGLQIS